jgi:hypothetical protein
MKRKLKKVSLNAETLRTLDSARLEDVAAGVTAIKTICYPCTGTNVCSHCKPCL